MATHAEIMDAFHRELPGCKCELGELEGKDVTFIYWQMQEGFMKMHVHHDLIENPSEFATNLSEKIFVIATYNDEEI